MQKTEPLFDKKYPKKLEDLDLIDNFLFQEMISQEGIGEEFAKILLGTILGKSIRHVKIVPQKNILSVDTDRHGIRLDAYVEAVSEEIPSSEQESIDAQIQSDIYDIEPNKTYEKKSLPKRMRYYHGLIDTQVLAAGTDYQNLKNVIIIVILPYDPFDKNRMVYTIQNQCIEDSDIFYDDGARKIFLYTKGTEGNPSQELKDMLKYIEKTTDENVTNQTIETINNLVNKVKRSKEVGINYMKSWEYEKMITERATREGWQWGMEQGMKQGVEQGKKEGMEQGKKEGMEQGKKEGMEQGMKQGVQQGIKQGMEQGINAFISLCKELDMSKSEAISKLVSKFNISPEKAEKYTKQYW